MLDLGLASWQIVICYICCSILSKWCIFADVGFMFCSIEAYWRYYLIHKSGTFVLMISWVLFAFNNVVNERIFQMSIQPRLDWLMWFRICLNWIWVCTISNICSIYSQIWYLSCPYFGFPILFWRNFYVLRTENLDIDSQRVLNKLTIIS